MVKNRHTIKKLLLNLGLIKSNSSTKQQVTCHDCGWLSQWDDIGPWHCLINDVYFWICLLYKVKRKLELDDVAEFKTPVSKCARSSCATKDVYSSYTGECWIILDVMVCLMHVTKFNGFKVQVWLWFVKLTPSYLSLPQGYTCNNNWCKCVQCAA